VHLDRSAASLSALRQSQPWAANFSQLRKALHEARIVFHNHRRASKPRKKRIADLREGYETLLQAESFAARVQSLASYTERVRADAEAKFDGDYPTSAAGDQTTIESRIRVTTFGNVLARLFTYSEVRYGIPLDTMWSRLSGVIDQTMRKRVEDATTLLDFSLVFATWSLVVAATGIGVAAGMDLERGLVTMGASAITFAVFVLLAVEAARRFSETLQACVDLHRRDLLACLGYEPPETIEAEQKLWKELFPFLARGQEPLPPANRLLPHAPAEE
jgi:hypothetical protein